MGKLIPAKIDKSSFQEKLKLLVNLGYLNRNRWDNTARICVLENEENYTNLLFCRKTEFEEFKIFNSQRYKTIITTIFQPITTDFLFATTLHYSKNLPLEHYEGEAFVSTSALLNSKTTKSCLKGGKTQELLDFIQLSRYDPVEEHHHVNDLSKIPEEQLSLFNKYFGQLCPAPHFHFASKQNADLFLNPTHLAINLFSLIHYVEDILKNDEPILQKYNLGLPILEIQNHPEIYQTTTNLSLYKIIKKYGGYTPKLQEDLTQLIHFNKSEQAKKIADNMLNSKTSYLNGLKALYVDLILLAGISGGPSQQHTKDKYNENISQTEINIKDALMPANKIINLGQNKAANHYTQTLQKNLFKDIIKELDKGEKQNEF
ncbi:MAG: hypothetical protein J6A98_03855 [Clostridia bacterium]|nr:hypothetical protein [Clostridia bacterium]